MGWNCSSALDHRMGNCRVNPRIQRSIESHCKRSSFKMCCSVLTISQSALFGSILSCKISHFLRNLSLSPILTFTDALPAIFWLFMNKGRYLSSISKTCLTVLNLVIFGIGCFMVSFRMCDLTGLKCLQLLVRCRALRFWQGSPGDRVAQQLVVYCKCLIVGKNALPPMTWRPAMCPPNLQPDQGEIKRLETFYMRINNSVLNAVQPIATAATNHTSLDTSLGLE